MAATLDINSMRYPIEVLEKQVTRDAFGAETIIYSVIYSLKAGIRYGSGVKHIDIEEIFTPDVITFTTHYRSISSDNIIQYDSKKYKINGINEIPYKVGLEINAALIND